jgi:hypothetical protein
MGLVRQKAVEAVFLRMAQAEALVVPVRLLREHHASIRAVG